MADQIYLAGLSDLLGRYEETPSTDRLDLNRVTLVPSGSAGHVPYQVYLARGRDADKPAIIVLLDGDKAGDDAVKQLKRGGPNRKQLIREEYITQIRPNEIEGLRSDRESGPWETEDLIPVEVGVMAAKRFLDEMGIDFQTEALSSDAVQQRLSDSIGVFDAIQEAVKEACEGYLLEKLPFARFVVQVCSDQDSSSANEMRERFAALFRHLTSMQRDAERERERETISARVDRETSRFIRDVLPTATKADVSMLLERIESLIDRSIEGDSLVIGIRRLKEDLALERNPYERITDRADLESRIEALKYEELLASQPTEYQATSVTIPGNVSSGNDHVSDGTSVQQATNGARGSQTDSEAVPNPDHSLVPE